ncbi:MAG: cytochrome c, partial [Actinomycetota bacterium]|nr:cytochrome c [Actinomycetota bacterium]
MAVLASFMLSSLACGASSAPEIPLGPNGESDTELVLGRKVWIRHCSSCHGSSGQGGRGKKLNSGKIFELYPANNVLLEVIYKGKGQSMPAFEASLSSMEIEAVARYIREVLN